MKAIYSWFTAILMALFLVACGGANTPEKVAIAYVQSVYQGDIDEVMDRVDMSDINEPGLEDMMRGKMKAAAADAKKQADDYGGVDSVSVEGEVKYLDENQNRARVLVKVVFNNDKTDSKYVKLIKTEKEGWKVWL